MSSILFFQSLGMIGIFLFAVPCPAQSTAPPREKETVSDAGPSDSASLHTLEIASTDRVSLRFGFILQNGFDLMPNQVKGARNSFTLQRARLGISGHILSKHLRYYLQGDALSGFGVGKRTGAPGSEILPSRGSLDIPFLLDARIDWELPQVGVTFTVGRFIPRWGLIMPENVTALGAISYPLYVYGGMDALGDFRSVGAQANLAITGFMDIGGGIFNGGRNTWRDTNDMKDMLVYVSIRPILGLSFCAAARFAFPDTIGGIQWDQTELTGAIETRIIPVIEARYQEHKLDLFLGMAGAIVIRNERDTREDYESFGFVAHAGYLFIGDWFQLMARVESWEPSNKVIHDDQLRVTIGPQLFFNEHHAQLRINYIHDVFRDEGVMCEQYLGLNTCRPLERPPEAGRFGAAILLQFTLAL
ncbi:MAG: porin [Myxococcota bacterium]|nr:porin [Myxococcota bacterium]